MIVFPMAGLSSRFFKAGYTKPKYMLEANGYTVFEHAVKSFECYFDVEPFLFIVRDVHDTPNFVANKAKELGVKTCHIVTLKCETRGQAETVFEGIQGFENHNDSLTIFNIDTFRPNYLFPKNLLINKDNYLEVFQGSGDNWSFVLPKDKQSTEVVETAEKRAISNLCCTGLYHFASTKAFLAAYNYYVERKELWEKGELYVAPLYNYLIGRGNSVHYHLIPKEEVVFCGVPAEYEAFKSF
ncbi:glycosyltransferase family 2 protein [Enterovibrio norvegicus]|uniref:glycosyltransferase family 2 protein n=1 Tax=Enterovibrio norvegicus TaxID=188144 RepID=UPI00352D1C05